MADTNDVRVACEVIEARIPEWHELPTTDQGRGICEWCGHAITSDWPAVQQQDGDDTVLHFHACSRFPGPDFPYRAVAS